MPTLQSPGKDAALARTVTTMPAHGVPASYVSGDTGKVRKSSPLVRDLARFDCKCGLCQAWLR